MKTKIKITIGENIYEVESTYEQVKDGIIFIIENIIKQELLIIESKR